MNRLMQIVALSLLLLLQEQAFAWRNSPDNASPGNTYKHQGGWQSARNEGITRDQAAAIVSKQTGGRILQVSRRNDDSHSYYLVKVLLPSGKVKIYSVDANSGEIR